MPTQRVIGGTTGVGSAGVSLPIGLSAPPPRFWLPEPARTLVLTFMSLSWLRSCTIARSNRRRLPPGSGGAACRRRVCFHHLDLVLKGVQADAERRFEFIPQV